MSTHALFSPSAAHRWIECPGSMAWEGNIGDSESSVYADDGTASHTWAAMCLKSSQDAAYFIDTQCTINEVAYKMDEERADFVQVYLDHVRRLAMGGILFVEHWVDLSRWLGEGQGGTADAGIIVPRKKLVAAVDLKYGVGERIDAGYLKDGKLLPNHQLGLYGLGLVEDARLLGVEPDSVLLVVIQPRLNHISEAEFSVADLEALGERAKVASHYAYLAISGSPKDAEIQKLMHPDDKTCRWCRAKAECPKLAKFVSDQVKMEFAAMDEAHEPPVPQGADDLGTAGRALPLIYQWCKAVQAAITDCVARDIPVIGVDGQPLKFVEGEKGDRKWTDEAAAEAALLASPMVGPEKAYAPRKILTAPQAAKILDKKATKATWKDIFEPMIKRAPGRPVLALGSDPRPRYGNVAGAQEFEDIGAE